MVFQNPKDWMNWLSMAEWWYNTTYHTSLKVSPFEALYAYHPPQIGELSLPRTLLPEARATVEEREKMTQQLRGNLLQAQDRMKYFADLKRTERRLQVGDNVYLKVQPFRQNAFGLRGSLKLRSKYYGPYRVLAQAGKVAYKLQLPETAQIHPVFQISHLKKHLGSNAIPLPNVPLVTDEGKLKTTPFAVLDKRVIQRNNAPLAQWLVHWENLAPTDATWEDLPFLQATFPAFAPPPPRAPHVPRATRGQVAS